MVSGALLVFSFQDHETNDMIEREGTREERLADPPFAEIYCFVGLVGALKDTSLLSVGGMINPISLIHMNKERKLYGRGGRCLGVVDGPFSLIVCTVKISLAGHIN